jgi:hypothetical protein
MTQKILEGQISTSRQQASRRGAYRGCSAQNIVALEGEVRPERTVRDVGAQTDGGGRDDERGDGDHGQLSAAVGWGDDGVGNRVGPVAGVAHWSNAAMGRGSWRARWWDMGWVCGGGGRDGEKTAEMGGGPLDSGKGDGS